MGCHIGIDVGAVSVKIALLADGLAAKRLNTPQAAALGQVLASPGIPSGQVLWITHYRRTQGRPIDTAVHLLDEVISLVDVDDVTGLAVAGSGADVVARQLGLRKVNEFKALAAAAAVLAPGVHMLFEMGGQTSKFLQLRPVKMAGWGLSTTRPTATAPPAPAAFWISRPAACTLRWKRSASSWPPPTGPRKSPAGAASSPRAT